MRINILCLICMSFFKFTSAFTLKARLVNSDASMRRWMVMATKDSHQESILGAGMTLAILAGIGIQPVFADNLIGETNLLQQRPQSTHIQKIVQRSSPFILTSFGAPSFSGGSSFETLDFSLPSYNEAVTGSVGGQDSTKAEPPSGPPAFTATFTEPAVSAPPSSPPKPIEKDEKVAKDKEAKVAADETKKAELQAKRALEKQKQLEMVERSKRAEKQRDESTATSVSEPTKAVANDVTAVVPKPPSTVLKKETPTAIKELTIPSFDIKTPGVPNIQLPSVTLPSFDAPKINVPDFKSLQLNLPKLEIPSMDTTMESSSSSSSSKRPLAPPSFQGSSTSSLSQPVSKVLESQEIRDQRARDARAAFDVKDEAAKEVEKKAAEARKIATESKRAFYSAKDEACATRFGGKLLCLRPWWSVGY